MKKIYLFFLLIFCTLISFGQTIFFNEIHYDNTSADVNEGFELAGPEGASLEGYSIIYYNGDGTPYTPSPKPTLTGVFGNQQNEYGTIWFNVVLQNGSPDGLALVAPDGTTVVQFLSYEGEIIASEGVATGKTSVDIGVTEDNSTPIGYSLQLTDAGWDSSLVATPDFPNTNQTTLSINKNQIEKFAMYPNPVSNGKLMISSPQQISKKVEIYAMLGKLVYKETINANKAIDVSNLSKGVYILKVEEEGKIATRKFIVK